MNAAAGGTPVPTEAELAAIGVAKAVMDHAWQHLAGSRDDLAGPAIPVKIVQLWHQQDVLVQDRQRDCNQHASAYNQAIAQFPAWLVAKIFAFQVAQTV